eukprot:scaffold53708_cov61-Cyclotella_meneghiniana.AAC.6
MTGIVVSTLATAKEDGLDSYSPKSIARIIVEVALPNFRLYFLRPKTLLACGGRFDVAKSGVVTIVGYLQLMNRIAKLWTICILHPKPIPLQNFEQSYVLT